METIKKKKERLEKKKNELKDLHKKFLKKKKRFDKDSNEVQEEMRLLNEVIVECKNNGFCENKTLPLEEESPSEKEGCTNKSDA